MGNRGTTFMRFWLLRWASLRTRLEKRNLSTAKILLKVAGGVIRAVVAVGIPEDEARCHFEAMEPHIRNILVIAGDLIEQHPALAGILLPSVVGMVARGPWLLRPIFGLLGFEPSSTLKGKAAAWAQSRFFGAHIPTRGWFSKL